MLVFPTGGPPSRRWRPVLWAQLATVAVLAVLLAIGMGEVPAGLEPLAALSGVVLQYPTRSLRGTHPTSLVSSLRVG